MLSITKQSKRENGETVSVVETQVTICSYMNALELWKELSWQDSLLESWIFENFCVSSFRNYCKLFIFKIPSSSTGF